MEFILRMFPKHGRKRLWSLRLEANRRDKTPYLQRQRKWKPWILGHWEIDRYKVRQIALYPWTLVESKRGYLLLEIPNQTKGSTEHRRYKLFVTPEKCFRLRLIWAQDVPSYREIDLNDRRLILLPPILPFLGARSNEMRMVVRQLLPSESMKGISNGCIQLLDIKQRHEKDWTIP